MNEYMEDPELFTKEDLKDAVGLFLFASFYGILLGLAIFWPLIFHCS